MRCIDSLKRLGTEKIALVHVLNVRDLGGLYHQLKYLIVPTLERQKGLLEEMGFEVEIEVLLGLPHVKIDRIARDRDVSFIVTHATAETLAGETFSGGGTHELLTTSEIPRLIMQARIVEEVKLLHVQEKARIEKYLKDRLEEFNDTDRGRLERLRDALEKKGPSKVEIEIPYGNAKKEIVERTQESEISLVVMGIQGRGFFGGLFRGAFPRQHQPRRCPARPCSRPSCPGQTVDPVERPECRASCSVPCGATKRSRLNSRTKEQL